MKEIFEYLRLCIYGHITQEEFKAVFKAYVIWIKLLYFFLGIFVYWLFNYLTN